MKGRSVSVKNLKEMLEATYEREPKKNIDDYQLDNELSNDEVKIYHKDNHAIVAFRGTESGFDWINNYFYLKGKYELTPRFIRAKETYDKAVKKYGEKNISVIGHSQGAVPARLLGKDSKEIITLNGAYTGEIIPNNEYDIRSSSDIVSGIKSPISFFNRMIGKKSNDIVIPSKSKNPIEEHKINILDRLDANRLIGNGFKHLRKGKDNVLTDQDLKDIAYHNHIQLNGIYNKDEIKSLRDGNYIINLNGHSHWTCLRKCGDNCIYFDSFGVIMPKEIEQLIFKKAESCKYNNYEIQGINQTSCGYYCLACLKFLEDTFEYNLYKFFDSFIGLFSKYKGRNEEIIKSILL